MQPRPYQTRVQPLLLIYKCSSFEMLSFCLSFFKGFIIHRFTLAKQKNSLIRHRAKSLHLTISIPASITFGIS